MLPLSKSPIVMCRQHHITLPHQQPDEEFSASGFCQHCGRMHGLPWGPAYRACLELIHHLQRYETIDLHPRPDSDPHLSTGQLFGEARGKMFGTLVGRGRDGRHTVLYAFSGQYNGLWEVQGWAPPLFDLKRFMAVNSPGEKTIKAIGAQMAGLDRNDEQWRILKNERRRMSRNLMQELHALYRLTDFQGNEATLTEAFVGSEGIPTGTGDCCAPKLLQQAARMQLQPLGIAEFFWGKSNRSATRHHGHFYPSCREKCQPILGHMLCGLDQEKKQ